MGKINFIYLIGILALISSSCSKDIDYQFKIKNNTIYDIDKMKFDFGSSGNNTISLKSFQNTGNIIINFSGREVVNPIDVHYTIFNYSTADSTFTNTIGHMLDRDELSEDNVNSIVIEVVPSSDNDIFEARLQ